MWLFRLRPTYTGGLQPRQNVADDRMGTPVPCSRRRQEFEAHSARPTRYGDSEDPRRDVAYATPEEKLLLVLTRVGLDGSKTQGRVGEPWLIMTFL